MFRKLALLTCMIFFSGCDTFNNYGLEVTENYIYCREWGNPKERKHAAALTIMKIEKNDLSHKSKNIKAKIFDYSIDSSFCYTKNSSTTNLDLKKLYFNKKNEAFNWLKGCSSTFDDDKEEYETIGKLEKGRWYVLKNVVQDIKFIVFIDHNGKSYIYKFNTNTGPW